MSKTEELIISSLILPIVKELVMPKVKSVIEKFSIKTDEEDLINSNFETYLNQRYEKYLIIDTLVFPNKQTLFKSLYEPLTVVSEGERMKKVSIKINEYPKSFLPEYFRVIIEDTAGMGKSTITRKLFLSIIEQRAGIPLLIELRQINESNDFLTEIQSQLSPIGNKISIDTIVKLINDGDFIFLLDGFDEISELDRAFVIKDLHRFIEKANENFFLMTSRQENSLASFGDFKKFNIKPLDDNEAYSLINKYDRYSFKPIAKDLINVLMANKAKSLKDFLSNPFLVSLLYKSFDYKKDIPLKKTQFYSQVYEALFEAHDLSKEGYLKREKYSNLHLDDFDRVLRWVGYLTSIKNKVEYERDSLINIIESAQAYTPDLLFKASDFLKDLLETVPLFKKDGNYIKWAHKSLQDYFAAKFIWIDSRDEQQLILKKIYEDSNNKRFYNVLDLFYELDANIFESTILLWVLEEFHTYSKTAYRSFTNIAERLLQERIENTFGNEFTFVVTKAEHYRAIAHDSKGSALIRNYYEKKLPKSNLKSSGAYFFYFENPPVILMNYHGKKKNIETILELISEKVPEIASYKGHDHHQKSLMFLEDEVYIVNDKIDNKVNGKKVFELTNKLTSLGYTLNYDAAIKKLFKIREINANRQQSNLLNW